LITRGNTIKTNPFEPLFTLQVGVFKTKAVPAEQEFEEYKAKRMKVNLIDRKMPDGSLRYVVTIGEYTSRKNAGSRRRTCSRTFVIVPTHYTNSSIHGSQFESHYSINGIPLHQVFAM
jgi:hypothetical protein